MIRFHLIKRLYHLGLLALTLLCLLSYTNFALAHPSDESLAHSKTLSVLKLKAFQNAMQLHQQKDFNAAARTLDTLLKRFPNNPIILNNLAVIASKQNKHDLAIHYLKAAIASNELMNLSYKNLSAIYLYQASQAYQQALALDTKEAEPVQLQMIEQVTLAKATDTLPSAKDPVKDPIKDPIKDLLKNKQVSKPLVEDPLPQTPPSTKHQGTNSQKVIAAVTQHIQSWARAWSKQNIQAYFSSYAPGYAPKKLSAQQWRSMRTQRITAPRTISVKVKDFKFDLYNEKLVTVVLTQVYQSNVLTSSTVKQLRLIRYKEGWKIVDEKVLR